MSLVLHSTKEHNPHWFFILAPLLAERWEEVGGIAASAASTPEPVASCQFWLIGWIYEQGLWSRMGSAQLRACSLDALDG